MPDPLDGTYKTKAQLIAYGFPEKFSQAFLNTAKQLNSVVMTRVTGGATTQLIEERYDLKGFFIKSKSCNWGPMSGFVCQIPLFNKSGSSNMEFNKEKTKDYEEHYFYTKNHANWKMDVNGNILDHAGTIQQGFTADENCNVLDASLTPVPGVKVRTPFVPLEISGTQKDSILTKHKNIELSNSEFIGIAYDKDKSVVMEFLLLKNTARNTWAVYHRNIQYRDPTSQETVYLVYSDYPKDSEITLANNNTSQLAGLWKELNLAFKPVPDGQSWWRVRGIQNPFPPYDNPNETHKNAVTGDYDLFSVWPVIPSAPYVPWNDLVRYSEQYLTSSATWPLFIPATGKKYSVRSTVSENIIVECIPSGVALGDGLMDPDAGNLHNLMLMVAQTLNSFVALAHGNKKTSPNASFHGDEGGRPGVKEIDFEVAVFLPPGLVPKGKQPIMLISNVMEFTALIEMLKDKCYIFLHYGWLMHLLVLCESEDGMGKLLRWAADSATEDLKDYFYARYREHKKLTSENITVLEKKLAKLLVPRPDVAAGQEAFGALVTALTNFTVGTKTLDDTEKDIRVLTANPFTGVRI